MSSSVPAGASAAVLQPSEAVPEDTPFVHGPDLEKPFTLQSLLGDYERIGFQATSFGKAIDIVNKMVRFISVYLLGVDDQSYSLDRKSVV